MHDFSHYIKEVHILQNYPVAELTHFCNVSVQKCTKIPENKIDFYDFTFVLEGSMTYIANGKRITLLKNDAIFLPPGTVRERETGTEPVAYASFNFYANTDFPLPFTPYMPNCINENIRKLIHVFPGAHRTGISFAQEKCTCLLNYILYELSDSVSRATDNVHVAAILRYIHEHMQERISLRALCAELKLTKEYTCTIFKKVLGKTITDYINERKMLLAREYILSGEIPLAEIATMLGYDNYNYFSRRFKRQFELTPMAFKKICK